MSTLLKDILSQNSLQESVKASLGEALMMRDIDVIEQNQQLATVLGDVLERLNRLESSQSQGLLELRGRLDGVETGLSDTRAVVESGLSSLSHHLEHLLTAEDEESAEEEDEEEGEDIEELPFYWEFDEVEPFGYMIHIEAPFDVPDGHVAILRFTHGDGTPLEGILHYRDERGKFECVDKFYNKILTMAFPYSSYMLLPANFENHDYLYARLHIYAPQEDSDMMPRVAVSERAVCKVRKNKDFLVEQYAFFLFKFVARYVAICYSIKSLSSAVFIKDELMQSVDVRPSPTAALKADLKLSFELVQKYLDISVDKLALDEDLFEYMIQVACDADLDFERLYIDFLIYGFDVSGEDVVGILLQIAEFVYDKKVDKIKKRIVKPIANYLKVDVGF